MSFQVQVKAKEKEQAKVDKIRADLAKKQKERNTLEEKLNTKKTIDELIELEAVLKKQNEEDLAIMMKTLLFMKLRLLGKELKKEMRSLPD